MPVLTLFLLALALATFVWGLIALLRGAVSVPAGTMTLEVARREDVTAELFTLWLRRSGAGRYLPLPPAVAGQSVSVRLPGVAGARRYSLARWQVLPFTYELTIKREAGGRVSPRLHELARPGAMLEVGRPQGTFTLPARSAARRAVFVAGGVGITPLLAMLDRGLATRRPYAEFRLYWQVRHDREALYRKALEAMAARHPGLTVQILVSRPAHGAGERLSVARLAAELGRLDETDYFLCAGQGLLDSMLDGLKGAGVPDEALHFERFTLGAATTSDEGWNVAYAGERFPFAGHASLLDAIEDRGLSLDADCRTGSCGRCLVAVEEGEAMHRVVPECAVPLGHVLACCAVPRSDLRLRAPSGS